MRRVLAAGTLGPTLLVDGPDSQPSLVVKLITTAVGHDAVALADALASPLAAPLADPGIVPVTEVGIDPAGVYLVAPFVDAPTLESRLRGGRQSLSQVLEWLVGPARALAAAHQQGRLHGAVHPRDVLLPRGRGVLTGLDISPALEAVGLQAPVRVPFTAPERASGKPWDARADQYSLAMLALDALSGRRLIAGTIPAFDRWTLADTPGEDARLHEVFARALHPDPAQRYDSVAEWLEGLTGAAEPASELSRFTREGVIPAAAPDLRRPPPTDEVDEAKSLALFPEEDPSGDVPASAATRAPAVSEPLDAAGRQVSPTGEWLVASMPDDAPPLADTGPLPIQSVSSHEDEFALPVATPTAPDQSDFALRSTVEGEGLGSDVVRQPDGLFWRDQTSDDDAPQGRRGLVIGAVLLIVALLAFGTWRSLSRPDGSRGEGTAVDGGGSSTPAAADASADGPSPVAEDALRPPADDLRPGRPPAVTPPASAPPSNPPSTPPSASPRASASASTPSPASPAASRTDRAAADTAKPPEARLSTDLGRMLIRSSPAGQVRVNGRPRGQTPLVLRDLPFGSYMVVISRPGYADVVRELDVLPSQPVASIAVDLERQGPGGTSSPVAPAGGEGAAATGRASAGQGPAGQASAGPSPTGPTATGRASAGQAPESQGPASQAAASASGPAAVPAGVGGLYVVSRPADARLFIDGQAYGTAPAVVPGLRAGRHVVRVELPGYRTWTQSVDVQPGQRVRVDATLLPESR